MATFTSHPKLSFPWGRQPGVNANHVALSQGGQLRFSGVAVNGTGNNFYGLFPKFLKGTVAGSPTNKIFGNIGQAVGYTSAAAARFSFAGVSAIQDSNNTFAAIIVSTTANTESHFLVSGNSSNYLGIGIDSTSHLMIRNGEFGSANSSTIVMSVNVPYFVAVSGGSTAAHYLQLNLNTGQIITGTGATVAPAGAPSGTCCVAGDGNSFSLPGLMAAACYTSAYLGIAELRQWAQDPWGFWYPNDPLPIILGSLGTPPSGALPPGKQSYDLPFTPPFRPQVSADQSMSIGRQILIKPQGEKSYDLPPAYQVPFRPQFSADQGTDAKRYVLSPSPITGPTQDLPVQPFRPQVSGDLSTPSLRYARPAGVQVYDTPIPPFRPQVSADLGRPDLLSSIKAPITGPTQDLPIPPFRPQFSWDQGTDAKRYVLTYPPITGPTQDLPIQPWRPSFSYDQRSAAPYAFPAGAAIFDLPVQPYRPLVGFDQHGIITAVVQVPLNLYDWPLPLIAAQFNRSYDQGSTTWLNLGTKPFAQNEWPLPIPPFRPDFAFMPSAPSWLVPLLPLNQYDWPLPIQPFRPQFSFDLRAQAAFATPFRQLDWPLTPGPFQFNRSFDLGSTQWLNLGTKPFAQTEWPLTPPPFRPDFTFMPSAPLWLVPAVVMPRNLYDWPLPIPPVRPQYGVTYSQQSFAPVPFNQFDWPVPAFWVPFRPQFSADQGSTRWLNLGTKPFAQTDWPLPRDYSRLPPGFYQIDGLNVGGIYTTPVTTVKIEWLIRARRRGRR